MSSLARTAYVHSQEHGAGSPVVALHGSASSGAQWRSLIGCLEGRFRVIVPDLPGYGGTPKLAGTGVPDLAALASALRGVFARAGEPVHLVGHGFGGALALKAAQMFPGQVRSLTLIEPHAFHLLRGSDDGDRRLVAGIDGLGDTLQMFACEGDAWAGMARYVDFWNGPGAWLRSSDRLRTAMAASIGQVLDDFLALEGERTGLADCRAIACPTLCVMGLQSPGVSMRVTELIAETVPGARLEIVADAGHMAPLTDPHVVDPAIRRHLLAAEGTGSRRNPPDSLAAAA